MICLIFKTITNEANQAQVSLQAFGHTISTFDKIDLTKKLNPNKIFNVTALKNFNNALLNGESRLQAWNNNIAGMNASTKKASVEIAKLTAQYQTGKLSEEAYLAELNAIYTDTERMTFAQKGLTAATKALGIASKALLNIGTWVLLSAAISFAVEKISSWINKTTELKQKTEELANTIKNLKDETKTLSEHSDTLVDEYAKLSRGVNDLGENVSLTNEEYDRYKELVNQVADDVPNLIVGYDNEGNAILKLRDNVDLLRQSYIEARKEKYKLVIADSADNAVENFNRTNDINNGIYGAGGLVTANGNVKLVAGQNISYGEIRETFDYVLKHTYDEFIAALKNGEISLLGATYISQMYDLGLTSTSEQFDKAIEKIRTDSITIQTEYKKAFDGIKSIAEAYLYLNDNYDALTEQMQNFASVLINTIPEDIAKTWESEYDINNFVTNLISLLQNATPEVQDALSKLLSLEIKDDSISNSKDEVDKYVNILTNYLNLDENYLKIQLGVSSVDDLADQLDHVINKAKDKFNLELDWQPTIENDFGINTEEEIKLFAECVDACDSMTAALDLYAEKVKDLPELTETFDYATYSEQVDTVVKNTNTLKKAIDTLTESGSLEADTIAELAKTFPAYSAQILAAQGNSERLKSVLTTAMAAQSSSLITTLEGLKGLSEEDQRAVDGLVAVLKSVNSESTKYADLLKDLANKESLLDSVHKELNDDGYISISTYQKLIEAGEDYADLVTIENGKLKIEEQALKDLIVQKYKDQVATIELAKAEKIRELAVMSSTGATQEEIQKIRDEIAELETAANRSKDIVSILEGYTPTDNGSKGNSKSLYSNELQLLKDDLNDGIITYEQFLQKWQALNDKYRTMSENEGGISDYEWGQNNRDIIAERTKAYEQEKARLKELYEAESITLEQYNAQLNASLNHWLGGYTQLSSEYEKEVKSNTKELSEYRKKEYDDEIKDLKELYENGEITLEQLDSKMSESANHWLGGIAGLSDEFKDAVNDNYDYIKTHFFDKIDRSLDELEDEYERTGDISLLDKRETTINDAISQADTELSKLYAKGLTEDNDDVQFWLEKQKKYNKDLESVLDERVDIVKDNVQETIEAFNDEYEKSGDTAIFDKQVSVYLQGQSAILDLIERYKDLGYSEESDAIKSLRKQYEEYGESIINVYDKITNAITDSVDKQIEAIEEKFEKTGDVNTINDKISVYQSGKTAVQTQIDKLIAKGYSESSEEVQKLVKQLADYDKEIIGVYDEITNYIETQTDNQLKSIDELVALTGDTSALYRKIDILNNGKLGIEGQIAKLLDEGYSESSEEVKSLYDKIKEYDNNILDVYSDIANRIDKETDKQLEIIDREIEKSGDTRQYQVRLNILADYKGQIQALIDELLKLGYDANSEIVQDLLSKIDSIDDDIRETSKDRIDAQVDAYEEVMSLESDQLEKYKDEQDEIFDGKIKALEDQKKALEDQSEEIEKQNELQEKQKNILDAQRGVMKSIRMIYSGNGQWTVSPTQESLENLKDAEKELEATQRKQQIEAIDKLIDGIEEQKKTFDDAIDEQTKAIQDGVDAFEKAMTDSYKVYAQLDYTLLKSILGEEDALKYYSDYNDVLAKNGVIDATMTTAKAELDDAVESLEEQSEANAKFTESTEQATKAVDTFAKKMQDEFGLGNVDLTTRPFVSGHKMRKAGYDVDPNGTSTVLSSVEYLWQGDEENGRYVGVHYTPILPNGEVLTDQELADYLHEVLEGSDDILKADNKGIILKIDDDLNLSEKDIRSLESGKLTKNMKTVLNAADAWDEALHNAQEKWMELWFAEYGNPNDSISAKAENIIDLFGNKVYGGILGKIQQILTNGSIGSLLPISSEALNQFTPKTASDQSNIVNSNIFNPIITNNITVNASSGNANDIRDAVKDVVDNRIIAGLKAFADGYNQSALNTMYGR